MTLELIRYMLDDLLDKYSQLSELRKDMQIKYFEVMGLIKECELDVNYEKCEQVRYEEIAHWNNELNLLFEYKYAIEEGLELINSGAVEQMLIEEERR